MSSFAHRTLLRQRFHHLSDAPVQAEHARAMLQLLLCQDGSTTRLCEAIAAEPVSLEVLEQRVVHAVPAEVRSALPGTSFIERITCLAAHGQVMMDNLSYIALEGLPPDLRGDIEGGIMPIGHLLARLWVRRSFVATAPVLFERLWGVVGWPDLDASRAYCIVTPEGPRMLIAETYRRGMRMEPGRPFSA